MKLQYYAPFNLPTGYGDAARSYARALIQTGVDLRLTVANDRPDPVPDDLKPFVGGFGSDSPTHSLFHTPPQFLEATPVPGSGKRIAYTTWETWSFPKRFVEAARHYDKILVPSYVCKSQMECLGDRVAIVPHIADERWVPRQTPREAGPVTFLWVGGWSERKNPIGVLKTYWSFFSKSDNVLLQMKLDKFDKITIEFLHSQTNRPANELPSVELKTEYMSHEALLKMYHQADAFISLSRGDAWNLPVFNAACLGVPIIATASIGHDQYLRDADDAVSMISAQPTPVYSSTFCLSPGRADVFEPKGVDCTQHWMEPDLTDAGYIMRSFLDSGLAEPSQVLIESTRKYAPAVVGKLLLEELESA